MSRTQSISDVFRAKDTNVALTVALERSILAGIESKSVTGVFSACAYFVLMPVIRERLRESLNAALESFRTSPLTEEKSLMGHLAGILQEVAHAGLDRSVADERELGSFRAINTPFRLARPGNTVRPIFDVRQPRLPTDRGFHQLPAHERMAEGKLFGYDCGLFINLFPFAALHSLLVPDYATPREQFLLWRDHELAYKVTRETTAKHLYLLYNGWSAHSSVNQIHFQVIAEPRGFAVESLRWVHNLEGGTEHYPVRCIATRDVVRAWEQILTFQEFHIAHNVVYAPDGRIYVFARRHQGTYPLANYSTGVAASELAGNIVLNSSEPYAYLTEAYILMLLEATKA